MPPPDIFALNESPSEKEGKFLKFLAGKQETKALNESPSEKEGKSRTPGKWSLGMSYPQ